MDDATGPGGFVDSYAARRLRGKKRGSGFFTISASREFSTPP
jgi:hypothetical protein